MKFSAYHRWGNKTNLALDAVLSRTTAEIRYQSTAQDLLALLRPIAAFNNTLLGECWSGWARRARWINERTVSPWTRSSCASASSVRTTSRSATRSATTRSKHRREDLHRRSARRQL